MMHEQKIVQATKPQPRIRRQVVTSVEEQSRVPVPAAIQRVAPKIETGIDLAGKPKIVFAAGRGKTGKTTLLRWMTETALDQGSSVVLADIDPTNSSFASYFEGVEQPEIDDPAGVRRWLLDLIEDCIASKQSAIIDLGGGDTTLRSLAGDLPNFAGEIEKGGLSPVIFYLAGNQPEDLLPARTLIDRGFSPQAQAIVFNETAIATGLTREQTFARVAASPDYRMLTKRAISLWMPRLFPMEALEARHCHFLDARDRTVTPQLGLFESAGVRAWLDAMNARFAGVSSWIP
ncbi:hypothetical protein ACELLULO517_27065 [Acidisoma cellulosilytica]|uniref:CobQ/CobB/MinD/ParA nucleotide binding domain-containing protein n=1 Tax=Acidisoma cellulosilyticum TaxID=2802395 RepID=A0A964E6Y1_9PROT|nr:hypothetical protein [Acidisoma cellulosilyticum]MCB8883937.1 hypothetical protein [Acidisoma cellulosilyticum]